VGSSNGRRHGHHRQVQACLHRPRDGVAEDAAQPNRRRRELELLAPQVGRLRPQGHRHTRNLFQVDRDKSLRRPGADGRSPVPPTDCGGREAITPRCAAGWRVPGRSTHLQIDRANGDHGKIHQYRPRRRRWHLELSAEARGDESMSPLRYPGYRNGLDQVSVVWPGDEMAVHPVCAHSHRGRHESVSCETS